MTKPCFGSVPRYGIRGIFGQIHKGLISFVNNLRARKEECGTTKDLTHAVRNIEHSSVFVAPKTHMQLHVSRLPGLFSKTLRKSVFFQKSSSVTVENTHTRERFARRCFLRKIFVFKTFGYRFKPYHRSNRRHTTYRSYSTYVMQHESRFTDWVHEDFPPQHAVSDIFEQFRSADFERARFTRKLQHSTEAFERCFEGKFYITKHFLLKIRRFFANFDDSFGCVLRKFSKSNPTYPENRIFPQILRCPKGFKTTFAHTRFALNSSSAKLSRHVIAAFRRIVRIVYAQSLPSASDNTRCRTFGISPLSTVAHPFSYV